MKQITIQPVTRIEGAAKVVISLDDSGNVSDARMHIIELRGFEKFCIGRPVEEMPRITPRICGVCPLSHHLCSAKACDSVFGVTPPSAGRKLRELANATAYLEEHILHFFFLAGADLVMGPGENYSMRNVFGIAQKMPELGQKVIRSRHLASKMLDYLLGKDIHPVAAVAGGFSKPLTETEREKMMEMAKELLEFSKFSIAYAKENLFSKYEGLIKEIGVIKTGFLGTVDKNGALNQYDGNLRLMRPDGKFTEFAPKDYLDHITERVEDWSYAKFPYAKELGEFNMDLDNPSGIFRVNTLARINACDRIATPLAQKELEEFRARFGRPAQQSLLFNWARLIELLYNAERVIELLSDPEITSTNTRVPVTPKAGRGVGCVEAPRGTLIHDYTTDENGLVTDANLVVATVMNNAAINMSVKQAAQTLIKGGKYNETILDEIEMVIRAYDPCLSCSTHELNGKVAVRLDIVDANGQLVQTYSN
ncbi:Ni/Fe hydrogenase subunit alpha [Dehalococcoides mccartyi]|jgi:F420-non-reducing hydrogenase large subunit|uniref:Hydrogenase 3 subunit VhuA n=2 Tax=Dehalococcoides TaxID=61434 RepID=A0A1S7AX33_9CHLR|nr:Ni/Fe hydrogenase subunit alpha [Dehalococcoides mccartyi]AGG07680.1 NiFe-hydrogenase group 3, VhcA / MvhA large subunit [Dehalococcoides mccartyi BTF08]AQW62244.1 Ni/Fe hydrogenase subunit alpha [Dehalococcoides mccartyi]AQX73048.1 Ni/Fe hydrogenase subunit alpha [Dehalococcoides mccartyi]AQX74425.1 Ni/Fe hydrogenase subunit alpha [Dehalococcoides mccartyi]AQY73002.1 Ni/Fe hydrogenase subunit alpha [Dehalococcoides mccartyi]